MSRSPIQDIEIEKIIKLLEAIKEAVKLRNTVHSYYETATFWILLIILVAFLFGLLLFSIIVIKRCREQAVHHLMLGEDAVQPEDGAGVECQQDEQESQELLTPA